MSSYVVLARWTDQGIKGVKETVRRAHQFRADCERRGIRVHDLFWTQGRYDVAVILEAPDEQALMAETLALGSLGNARTETLRAFTDVEMEGILRKL
ncbi:MAG TPA: GYD domain-containing protein [Ktedonobacterales bacterium]|jgi:uncharacterized protein with GYD domain